MAFWIWFAEVECQLPLLIETLNSDNLVSLRDLQFVGCDVSDFGSNGDLVDNAFSCAKKTSICKESRYTDKTTGGTCQKFSFSVEISQSGITGCTGVSKDNKQAWMEALSKQLVMIVIEADQFFTDVQFMCAHKFVRLKPFHIRVPFLDLQMDLNRTYMSYRLEFLLRALLSLDSPSGISEISGDPDLIVDSVFDDLNELLSLLQNDGSLNLSVAVKSNGDLFSDALPDESDEDQVLLLQTVTCQNGERQSTVETFEFEFVNNVWHPIHTDLMFECVLTFTVESRKAERACANMTSILFFGMVLVDPKRQKCSTRLSALIPVF